MQRFSCQLALSKDISAIPIAFLPVNIRVVGVDGSHYSSDLGCQRSCIMSAKTSFSACRPQQSAHINDHTLFTTNHNSLQHSPLTNHHYGREKVRLYPFVHPRDHWTRWAASIAPDVPLLESRTQNTPYFLLTLLFYRRWGWVNRVNRVPEYQKLFQEGQKQHTRQWLQVCRTR